MTTWVDPTGLVEEHKHLRMPVLQNALFNDLSMSLVCLARRTTTKVVTSNTTPQDDDVLFFQVGANELWYLRHVWRVSAGASVDVDFKVQFSAPSGAEVCFESGGLSASGALAIHRWFDTTTQNVMNVSSTTSIVYVAGGFVYTGQQSGIFRLKWSQGNSSATATNLLAGSCILGTRLGVNPKTAA